MQDPEHLCKKVYDGKFSTIHLLSVTYYGPHRLWLFESERKYSINRTLEMSNDAIFFPLTNYTPWNGEQLNLVVGEYMKLTKLPKAIYFLGYIDPDKYLIPPIRNPFIMNGLWMNLLTETTEQMWDLYCILGGEMYCRPKEVWTTTKRVRPDYALLLDQFNDQPKGYVLHEGGAE